MKAVGKIKLHKICFKCASKVAFFQVCLGLQNGGAYIGHPMCETTRKPNILANTRDKEVLNQNKVGWH